MGLPHVVVRFYTNPDGRPPAHDLWSCSPSRRLYVLPPVFGALGSCLRTGPGRDGCDDTVVLELPARMVRGRRRAALRR
jgi:hypothetical protein